MKKCLGSELIKSLMENPFKRRISLNVNEYQYLTEAYDLLMQDDDFCDRLNRLAVQLSEKEVVYAIYTYNNIDVMVTQLQQLKKFTDIDVSSLVYVDNSTNDEIAEQIAIQSNIAGASYIRIPHFKELEGENIYHHPKAIELSWYLLFNDLNNKWFIMLDHDIFPIVKYSFKRVLVNMANSELDFYGLYGLQDFDLKSSEQYYHYPWPGFGFWNAEILRTGTVGKRLHKNRFETWKDYGCHFAFDYLCFFDENRGWSELDTGGTMTLLGNFIAGLTASMCKLECRKVKDDYIEVIDEAFLHLRDTSDWSGEGRLKEKYKCFLACSNSSSFDPIKELPLHKTLR